MFLPAPPWLQAPVTLLLPGDGVHIWAASLDVGAAHLKVLQFALSADEQRRADRFLCGNARREFIAGRGLLRMLLGRYLHCAPRHIQFAYIQQGKPVLVPGRHPEPLFFNASHTNGVLLMAFTGSGEIGVDVEYGGRRLDKSHIAGMVFSPSERAYLDSLPVALQSPAFFKFWARKEAYIKALGLGLTAPLQKIEVLHAPDKPVAELDDSGAIFQWTDWFLRDIPFLPDYSVSVAFQGEHRNILLFNGLDTNTFDAWSGMNTV